MSLNQIIYEVGDTINENLNLKANTIQVKNNINVPFINGFPYMGGSVNVGNPYDLLQTNAAGTNPEWTSDIKVNDCEIDGQIDLNGNTGLNNQVIVKSAGAPTWGTPTFTLPSIPIGMPDQILQTNNAGTSAEWTSDIDVDNCDINQQLSFNGTSGSNGQIVIKSGGVPTWGTPTFTLPSIPIGTPRQLLQTNSAGTSAEWTSDISVANTNITGNLQMNGTSGVTGQALVKTSAFSQGWGKIGSQNITPGPANYVMVTDTFGTTSTWANNLSISALNLTTNLSFNGVNGVTGQFVKKAGSAQLWSNIIDSDITPGLANQVMTTNSTGTDSKWSSSISVDGNLIFNGIYGSPGQFVKKVGGSQIWANIQDTDIDPGLANQVLVTDPTGTFVTWTNAPSIGITPGTAYQILQTDSTGSSVEWTSQFRGTSILFNSPNQSIFNNYYNYSTNLTVYATPANNPVFFSSQLLSTPVEVVIIGNRVEITIFPFQLFNLIGSVTSPAYVFLRLTDSWLIPRAIFTPSNYRTNSFPCNVTQESTINYNAFASVYSSYYSFGSVCSCIEFTSSNTSTYNPNGDHGGSFAQQPSNVMKLNSPLTVSYYI